MIKRGRKYGIILLLATQSPTKDSIPKEITRNVSCGVAFAVADHIANDGLLGAGRYRAGIRATELRTKTDRGTCVAVGLTDEPWELVRTYYVPFEDEIDLVSPVVARSMSIMQEHGRDLAATADEAEEEKPPPDLLTDIADVMGSDQRLRTQAVLTRLASHDPENYDGWTFTDLSSALAEFDIRPVKSRGIMVLRAADLTHAINTRNIAKRMGEASGEAPGSEGVLPHHHRHQTPPPEQGKRRRGRQRSPDGESCETAQSRGSGSSADASLPRRDDPGQAVGGGP